MSEAYVRICACMFFCLLFNIYMYKLIIIAKNAIIDMIVINEVDMLVCICVFVSVSIDVEAVLSDLLSDFKPIYIHIYTWIKCKHKYINESFGIRSCIHIYIYTYTYIHIYIPVFTRVRSHGRVGSSWRMTAKSKTCKK